jgi:hypothetical protein
MAPLEVLAGVVADKRLPLVALVLLDKVLLAALEAPLQEPLVVVVERAQ